jgi:hypothetical protein
MGLSRPVVGLLYLLTQKLEVLYATRNLAGTRINIEQDYSTKVQELHK